MHPPSQNKAKAPAVRLSLHESDLHSLQPSTRNPSHSPSLQGVTGYLSSTSDQDNTPEGWDTSSIFSAQTAWSETPTYHSSYAESVATITQPHRYASAGFQPSEGDYVYRILKSGSKTEHWAALRLRAPSNSQRSRAPCLRGGEDVLGAVELTITNPQTIRSISIVVRTLFAQKT